jgi:hypothetical protein
VEQVLWLLSSGPQTASSIASWMFGDKADHAAVAKARRRLEALVRAGQVVRIDEKPRRGGPAGGAVATRYALVEELKVINSDEIPMDER